MSLSLHPHPSTNPPAECSLPVELIHGIEAAVAEMNPQLRAAAISRLVQETHQTQTWLLDGQAGHVELASFGEVVAAAAAHQDRMAALLPAGPR